MVIVIIITTTTIIIIVVVVVLLLLVMIVIVIIIIIIINNIINNNNTNVIIIIIIIVVVVVIIFVIVIVVIVILACPDANFYAICPPEHRPGADGRWLGGIAQCQWFQRCLGGHKFQTMERSVVKPTWKMRRWMWMRNKSDMVSMVVYIEIHICIYIYSHNVFIHT